MNSSNSEEIRRALAACKQHVAAVFVFSLALNLLALTPLFYMLNVYDKAVASGSYATLVALASIALFLYAVMAGLEWVRAIVFQKIAAQIDRDIGPRVYQVCFESESGRIDAQRVGAQPLADLQGFRQFIGSPAASVLFDLPWVPLFLLLMVMFHPTLAVVAVICMVILLIIAIANQKLTTAKHAEVSDKSRGISQQVQSHLRNAEVAAALGMAGRLETRWRAQQDNLLGLQESTMFMSAGFSSVIKTLTMVMQSAAITTGAALVLSQEISPGVMIAAALLLGRSLSPMQTAVSSWRSIVEARDQYSRLNDLLTAFPEAPNRMQLPPLEGRISMSDLVACVPGTDHQVVRRVSLSFEPGTITMIMGPSGSGKSSLIKVILGLWPAVQGKVRIDNADAFLFNRQELGDQIGYLPQGIELFDGSISENIARFGEPDPESTIQAARDAGVHEMILKLKDGYDTKIGLKGVNLSPGQRQRLALARALYKRPKILLLDEPNSNLDEAGERALNASLETMRAIGSTVVLVSHRQSALSIIDKLVVMEWGVVKVAGNKEDVLQKARAHKDAKSKAPVKVVATGSTGEA